MANLVTTEANRLLDTSLPNSLNSVYLALTSTAPTAGAAGTKLTGNGYARQSLGTPTAASAGAKTLPSAQINFPTVVTADWLTILGYEVWDASTAGNRRWFRSLSVAEQRTPKVGDTFRVAANALTFTAA
jgi:hypothetical protein